MATTMMAVAIKIAVATIERAESRAMPQMPWPDVHPPPSRVNEPQDESEPPDLVASREGEAPAENAANAGYASSEHHQ